MDAQRELELAVRLRANLQQGIQAFGNLKKSTNETRDGLAAVGERAKELAQELKATDKPAADLQRKFSATVREARALKEQLAAQQAELHRTRAELSAAGVDVANLAAEYRRLGAEGAAAQTQLAAAAKKAASEQDKASRWAAVARERAARLAREEAAAAQLAAAAEMERAAAAAKAASTAQDKTDRWAAVARSRQEREAATQAAAAERESRLNTIGAAVSGNASSSMQSLGLRDSSTIRREILGVEQALQRLSSDSQVTGADYDRAFAAAGRRTAALRAELQGVMDPFTEGVSRADRGLDALGTRLRPVAAAVAGAFAVGQLMQYSAALARIADQYKNLTARITLLNSQHTGWNVTLGDTARIAQNTSSALEGTVRLAFALGRAGKEIGLTQAEVLGLTSTINKANQLGGESAEATDAALVQLIQGLQSGVLRGEEFNSVMEQSPRLAQALADGLGKPLGALRALAEDGRLTTATVVGALQSQSRAIDAEFDKLPKTVGRALTNLQTSWTLFVGQLDSATGASAAVAGLIEAVARNLDELGAVAARAGVVLVAVFAVQAARAFRSYVVEATLARRATDLLALSVSKLPRIISLTVAVTGFEVGYQIGEMLHENFALARKLGVGIVGFFELVINDLRGLKEIVAALFTDDTVDAAIDRYIERNKQIGQILGEMFADAERSPAEIRRQNEAAAEAQERLGSAAAVSGAQIAGAMSGAAGAVASVKQAGDEARAALAALGQAGGLRLSPTGTNQELAAGLAEGVGKSAASAKAILAGVKEQISELSGKELDLFGANLVAALTTAAGRAEAEFNRIKASGTATSAELSNAWESYRRLQAAAQATAQQVGERAAEALGVDLSRYTTTLSESYRDAANNFAALLREMPKLKAAGIDTGGVLSAAIEGMTAAARNSTDIDALLNRIQALGTAGQLSGGALVTALESVRTKAREARSEGVDKLRESLTQAAQQARELRAESDKLYKEAAAARAASTKKASDRGDKGLTDEQRDTKNATAARDALADAEHAANLATSAAYAGRTKNAKDNAEQALALVKQAAEAADAIGDDDVASKLIDRIGAAEEQAMKAQAQVAKTAADEADKVRQQRATELAAAVQQQESEMSAIESRINAIAAAANVKLSIDTTEARTAVDELKASLATLPASQTLVIKAEVAGAGASAGNQSGAPAASPVASSASMTTVVDVQADTSQAQPALQQVTAAVDAIPAEKTVVIKTVVSGTSTFGDAAGLSGTDIPAHGYGGAVAGRAYGDRSDNQLIWATPGEHVIQRPAVRYYGDQMISAINNMRFPKFGFGGIVGGDAASAIAESGSPGIRAPLTVPGVGTFDMGMSESVYDALAAGLNRVALQSGRRRGRR